MCIARAVYFYTALTMINIYMVANLSQTDGKIRLRSPRIASRVFGLNNPGQLVTAVPRMRFMFYTKFELSAAGKSMTNNAVLNGYDGNRSLSFKVKQVDKPKITLTTQELNHYNKKKVIYTKIDYGEASIRLYDSVDDSVLATWIDYFTFYFGDSRVKRNQNAYSQSPVDAKFTDDSGWGLRPLSNDTQFFDRITVYGFYANTYTAFSYINPKITTIDWQQRDYSSEEPEEVNISFKYEAIEYEAFGQPVVDSTVFGWQPIDSLDIPGVLPNIPTPPQPRIFSTQPAVRSQRGAAGTAPDENAFLDTQQRGAAGTAPDENALLVTPTLPNGSIAGAGVPEFGPPIINYDPLGNVTGTEPGRPIPPRSSTVVPGTPMRPTYDPLGNVTGTEPIPPANPVAPVRSNVNSGLGASIDRQIAQRSAETRRQVELLNEAAVAAGLIPPGTRASRISGNIVGGNIVTSVTVDGRTIRPTLSAEDQDRVNRLRQLIAG